MEKKTEQSNRLGQLLTKLSSAHLDGALITSGVGIRYLTGFTSSDAVVLVTMRKNYLFTDFRYTIQAKEQVDASYCIVEFSQGKLYDEISAAISENGCKACACEQDDLTVARYQKFTAMPVKWQPLGDMLSSLRLIKSADEIIAMQRAQQIADEAYTAFLSRVKIGMTEREAVAELNYVCSRLGSEGPSFDPIIGSGPNGAMCHAVPGERKLQNGDLVVVDFGCIYNGYHSDMTRTFGIGKISPELTKIYGIVLEAQQAALTALTPGIGGKALDKIARDVIASYGYADAFGHSLGHGVGLEIHESPRASVSSEDTLLPGMSITVEPGIYLEGKGGVRTEDCCILTEDGYLNLTSVPKELVIL